MKNCIVSLTLTVLALFTGINSAQAQYLDSLYDVFCNSKGEKRVIIANEIAKHCFESEYFDTLIRLKTSDDKALVDAVVNMAMGAYFNSWGKDDFVKSNEFFKLTLAYYEKIGDAAEVNSFNKMIGNNYSAMGNYGNAISYLMKCYEWEKSIDNKKELSTTLYCLGVQYHYWQKSDMAIHFYEEAIETERLFNRSEYLATYFAALAKEYSDIDINKSLSLIKEALQYDEKIASLQDKEDLIAVHILFLGNIYDKMDSVENTENCYLRSLDYFRKNEQSYNLATALNQLGCLQLKQKQYGKAIALFKECEEIAEKNHFLYDQQAAYLYLSEAYSQIEPKSMSYFYLKKYKTLSDSLFDEESQEQINDFQVKYETAEKELEIERQKAKIKQQRTRLLIYIGVLIASGLLLTMLVFVIVIRNRRNRELTEMNAIKDKFFSIISHDLKNPAIAQRDALQLLADYADKWETDTLTDYYNKLLASANGLVDLLKNLLNWAAIQTGREIYRAESFNLVAALQSDINLIKSMAERKNINFETLLPPTAVITADENMLTTVIRNLLANAVKFTAEGGTISLHIEENKEKYNISITDNGIGMNQEQIQNLYRIDRAHSRKGTANERGTGLGLIVCKEMLEKHGSNLHIDSTEGKGSRFWFEMRIE